MIKLGASQALTLLRYRTHMSHYSSNFKGSQGLLLCPLCKSHDDIQDLVFDCPAVQKELKPEYKYEDIFKDEVSTELVNLLVRIENLRSMKNRQY